MLKQLGVEGLLGGNALSFVFQPIFDVTGHGLRTFAFEALARGPADSHFANPSILFDYLRLKRAEVRGDRRCIASALRDAGSLPGHSRVALNIHAASLERDPSFPKWVIEEAAGCGVQPSRLILEIVEQSQYFDPARVRRAAAVLREAGASLALDDVGSGYCNYRSIVELHPALLKVDRYFIRNCSADRRLQAVIRSVRMLADDLEARVVAEGVETDDDLRTIRKLGIPLAQGFGLARPFSVHETASAAPGLCYA